MPTTPPLQTLTSINTLLERADQVYKLLVQHHNDLDQLLISLASGLAQGVSRAVSQLFIRSLAS